jgi:hypothetical protein
LNHQVGDDAAAHVPRATRKESDVSKPQPFEHVGTDMRRDEILTNAADEHWATLLHALAVVVGSAEITAWSKQSVETVARQFPELSHLVPGY